MQRSEVMLFGGCLLLLLAAQCGRTQLVGDNVQYRPGECLRGDMHKELASPEPEGPAYQACFQWRSLSCCTAEFTQQLARANVTNIDGFHWNRCGNLSPVCERFFIHVECFYRCSPHVAHWALPSFSSALANLPVCHEFCDEWFLACAEDLTCVENWITEWVRFNGQNYCPTNSTCRTFREVYGNGSGLCERLWGQSFIYSEFSQNNEDRECMTLWWPEGQPNPNEEVIQRLFNAAAPGVGKSVPVALIVSLLALLLLQS